MVTWLPLRLFVPKQKQGSLLENRPFTPREVVKRLLRTSSTLFDVNESAKDELVFSIKQGVLRNCYRKDDLRMTFKLVYIVTHAKFPHLVNDNNYWIGVVDHVVISPGVLVADVFKGDSLGVADKWMRDLYDRIKDYVFEGGDGDESALMERSEMAVADATNSAEESDDATEEAWDDLVVGLEQCGDPIVVAHTIRTHQKSDVRRSERSHHAPTEFEPNPALVQKAVGVLRHERLRAEYRDELRRLGDDEKKRNDNEVSFCFCWRC